MPDAQSAPAHHTDETSGAGRRPVRRALVSVYDKTGLEDLVRGLHDAGVALVSTGGSAALIASLDIPVTSVEDLTGFPECLDGRVKTLHPRVHAGLLADTRRPEHLAQLGDLGVEAFELVVGNLYPFAATVASGATPDECIEQIDIGGPTMVRAAAKNHPSVAIVTSPQRYAMVLDAVRDGGFTLEQRKRLAAEAFVHTATYDTHVASWLGNAYTDTSDGTGFPQWMGATWDKVGVLRYGENPHQRAALYANGFQPQPGLAQARVLHGKEMSYNNYVDADAAVRAAYDHGDRPTVAVVKHANPCGIAVATEDEGIAEAHRKAHECDPVSAFGGIIATNRPVTREMAERVRDIFTEVVVAPSFDEDALAVLTGKKNIRLVECAAPAVGGIESRPISGGLLLQSRDAIDAQVRDETGTVTGGDLAEHWRLVAGEPADQATLDDLQLAWRAVRAVKSNAILLARDGASVGIGMGQVNRLDSCRLAVARAGEDRARDAVAASDAFFPFADGLEILLDAGVRAVVAPGGSVRDAEVVEAAQRAGVTLYFTGTRHFAH
jgi:phosphoribosylaminoimidazolecarboxamide formyltransferase / IMP cyclohydrolase